MADKKSKSTEPSKTGYGDKMRKTLEKRKTVRKKKK
jgi:hypothetical protein